MDSDSETGEFSPAIFIRSTAAGRTRFPSGDIVATPGAIETVGSLEMSLALTRHLQCDWGDLDKEDISANNRALEQGGRLVSAFKTQGGTKFWIITEADRSVTTILLPEEY
jgi:hypothetical protein